MSYNVLSVGPKLQHRRSYQILVLLLHQGPAVLVLIAVLLAQLSVKNPGITPGVVKINMVSGSGAAIFTWAFKRPIDWGEIHPQIHPALVWVALNALPVCSRCRTFNAGIYCVIINAFLAVFQPRVQVVWSVVFEDWPFNGPPK